jgi:hypothetical protein
MEGIVINLKERLLREEMRWIRLKDQEENEHMERQRRDAMDPIERQRGKTSTWRGRGWLPLQKVILFHLMQRK